LVCATAHAEESHTELAKKLGPQILQLQLGDRSYVTTPAGGPNGGLRFGIVLLFPK
jgi:hypothetical protein